MAWVLARGPAALRVEQREEPAGLQAGPGLWRAADVLTFHQRRQSSQGAERREA